MDYKEYQSFCVERSHTDLDEISFRLLRAATGFVAEIQEYMLESDEETLLDEMSDVLFWTVTLDYWLTKLEVPLDRDIKVPSEVLEGSIYVVDCVEKYSRNKNIQKLLPVRTMISSLLEQFLSDDADDKVKFDTVSTRNYNKLTSVRPRVSVGGNK
jgi:hypothetical protein